MCSGKNKKQKLCSAFLKSDLNKSCGETSMACSPVVALIYVLRGKSPGRRAACAPTGCAGLSLHRSVTRGVWRPGLRECVCDPVAVHGSGHGTWAG